MKNYKLNSNKFNDLFTFADSIEDCELLITQMNFNEILERYYKNVDELFKQINKINQDLFRISNTEITIYSNVEIEAIKSDFLTLLTSKFQCIDPSHSASNQVFYRYYHKLKPLDGNKKI